VNNWRGNRETVKRMKNPGILLLAITRGERPSEVPMGPLEKM
jgi:hypothetical protein